MDPHSNSDIKQDYCCGLIPVWKPTARAWEETPETEHLYLLILHQKGHWAFPKGHPEPGETDLQTACREVTEETGLTAFQVIPDRSFEEVYQFRSGRGKTIVKRVTYFIALMYPTSDNHPPLVKVQWAEVSDFRWCTYAEALELITFPANRQVLQDCEAFLAESQALS